MDSLIVQTINRYFTSIKALDLFNANELLTSLNYTHHLDELTDLVGTDNIDNSDNAMYYILGVFEDAVYGVLVTMGIVPSSRDFNDTYPLLQYVFTLDAYLDHDVICELIDEQNEGQTPKQILIHLIVQLLEGDWALLGESLFDVKQSLIDTLYQTHTDALELDTDEVVENPLARRINGTRHFFNLHPNTKIQQLIRDGRIATPCEEYNLLPILQEVVYDINDLHHVALEILAATYVLPITLSSIPTQAKLLVSSLYANLEDVSQITTTIDDLVAKGGLTNVK